LGESASVSDWDVVVVGGGGTGLAAAAEAASLGCRVVVLEKNSMHNVVPNSKSFAYHLARHCRRRGVEIRTRTRAKALVIEHDRVVAVECDTKAGKHRFAAKRAVVLASGDYSADRELKAHFARPEVVNVEAVNQNQGPGVRGISANLISRSIP